MWIDLRSPTTTYAATTLDRLSGSVAYDGREIEVLHFPRRLSRRDHHDTRPDRARQRTCAMEMLVGVRSPANATPYVSELLAELPLNAACAGDGGGSQSHIDARRALGRTAAERVSAIFNVDDRGVGSIGPVEAEAGDGSLYARIALDQPHRADYGIVEAENFPIRPARAALSASLYGARNDDVIGVDGIARAAGAWGARIRAGKGRLRTRLPARLPVRQSCR